MPGNAGLAPAKRIGGKVGEPVRLDDVEDHFDEDRMDAGHELAILVVTLLEPSVELKYAVAVQRLTMIGGFVGFLVAVAECKGGEAVLDVFESSATFDL